MRRHNELLILTLLRQRGPMPRSELAAATGLSSQTATNITRDLLARGLVAAEDRVRGRVGQPTTPLALAPRSVFSVGLKVGRRSLEAVLVDFSGAIVDRRETLGGAGSPDAVLGFAAASVADMLAALAPDERGRLAGLGIAMPFRLWDWGSGFAAWEGRDPRAEIAAATGLSTWLENDASCACAAELLLGRNDLPTDFLYVYLGHYAGGGLVLDGRLRLGPRGNAGAVGSVPVPGPRHPVQLLDLASLATLEAALGGPLPRSEAAWRVPAGIRDRWLDGAAAAIAFAALSAVAVCDLDAVVIDGALPPALRDALAAAVGRALPRLPSAGIGLPAVLAGSLGRTGRALGAAILPLAALDLIDSPAGEPRVLAGGASGA